MNKLRNVILLGYCLALSGCLFTGGRSASKNGYLVGNGPRGNGEGFLGAIATVGNALARCGFGPKSDKSYQYEVHCRVAIKDAAGNEVEAIGVEEGTTLSWGVPAQIAGPPISDLSCQTGSEGLTQTCDVTLTLVSEGLPQYTELEFALQPFTASFKPEPSKTSVVFVSAESYGVVPHLPTFQAIVSNEEGVKGRSLAGQYVDFDPNKTIFGVPTSICTSQGRTYFATRGFVFVVQNGKARLYAGNSNLGNVDDLSSRFQLAFQFNLRVHCFDEGLVVRDSSSDNEKKVRFLLIKDEGPVIDLASSMSTPGSNELRWGNSARGADGKLYVFGHRRVSDKNKSTIFQFDLKTMAKAAFLISDTWQDSGEPYAVNFPYLYFGRKGANVLNRVDMRSGEKVPFAGTGENVSSDASGPALTLPLLYGPVAVDVFGNVFEISGRRIRKIDAAGNVSTVFGADGGTREACSPTATITTWSGTACGISSIATDETGALYVGTHGMMIHKVLPSGSRESFAGVPFFTAGATKATEDLKTAAFNSVRALAFDGDSILISETYNGFRRIDLKTHQVEPIVFPKGALFISAVEVRRLPDGRVLYTGGESSYLMSADGTRENLPAGQVSAFGPNGKFYYGSCGWGVGNIWVQDLATKEITLLATSATATSLNDGGDALQAKFCEMGGLEVGLDNALYFSDRTNKRIRRIDLATRVITTIAGGGTKESNEDGWADEGILAKPQVLRFTSQGDLYLTDSANGTIRAFHPVVQSNGSTRYTQSTLVGKAASSSACSGQLRHSLHERDRAAEIRTSLKSFCSALPRGMDVRDSCGQPNGQIEIAYSQAFDNTEYFPANISVITRPCR